MTDEADSSVVLAELQVALFRECNNQRLSPWGRRKFGAKMAEKNPYKSSKRGVTLGKGVGMENLT